jgi:peptidoglycan/xylan/chitin deacetylase (PgdA/CDA1 family)
LTVVMFHRVLAPDDRRTRTALVEWTIGDEAFDASLFFFRRHYNLVSLDDVVAAAHGTGRLPQRSLLLTFDDGFADNLDYALPLLRKHRAPAVVFISTDVIGRSERLWTEDLLWAARAGSLREADLQALYRLTTGHAVPAYTEPTALVREIVRRGPSFALTAVESVLGARADLHRIREPRQMLDREGIVELARHGVAIGAHGKTHTALDYAQDLADELETPRATLCSLLGPRARPGIDALSFPHGAYTPEILDRALAAGYRLFFTVKDELARLDKGRLRGSVIGRINVDGQRFAGSGQLRTERLAFTLFTQRHSPSGRRRRRWRS